MESTVRSLRRAVVCASLLAAMLATGSGCTMPGKIGWTQVGWTNVGLTHVGWLNAQRDREKPPEFQRTHIVYELPGPHGALVWTSLEPFAVAGVSDDDFSPYGGTRWKSAVLKIDYPHPEGLTDTARAELRLSRASADAFREDLSLSEKAIERSSQTVETFVWRTEKKVTTPPPAEEAAAHDELWVLDFPKHELDQMVSDLAEGGIFDEQVRPDGGARIEVSINRKQTTKMWTPDPRLDDLILRTYREGRLEGYIKVVPDGNQATPCAHRFGDQPIVRPSTPAILRQSAMILENASGDIVCAPSLIDFEGSM